LHAAHGLDQIFETFVIDEPADCHDEPRAVVAANGGDFAQIVFGHASGRDAVGDHDAFVPEARQDWRGIQVGLGSADNARAALQDGEKERLESAAE
jgi:hypothetical protein